MEWKVNHFEFSSFLRKRVSTRWI